MYQTIIDQPPNKWAVDLVTQLSCARTGGVRNNDFAWFMNREVINEGTIKGGEV
jgi:hypothetical protein